MNTFTRLVLIHTLAVIFGYFAYQFGYARGLLAGMNVDYSFGSAPFAGYQLDANGHSHPVK